MEGHGGAERCALSASGFPCLCMEGQKGVLSLPYGFPHKLVEGWRGVPSLPYAFCVGRGKAERHQNRAIPPNIILQIETKFSLTKVVLTLSIKVQFQCLNIVKISDIKCSQNNNNIVICNYFWDNILTNKSSYCDSPNTEWIILVK